MYGGKGQRLNTSYLFIYYCTSIFIDYDNIRDTSYVSEFHKYPGRVFD